MYIVDKQTNTIKNIKPVTFTELGFKERGHLQEWLEGHAEALGEELLVIQKEFNGFSETNEQNRML